MCRIYPYFLKGFLKTEWRNNTLSFIAGQEMIYFFSIPFFKVDLLTYIIMKEIISYIYPLFVPVELAPAGNNLSLS